MLFYFSISNLKSIGYTNHENEDLVLYGVIWCDSEPRQIRSLRWTVGNSMNSRLRTLDKGGKVGMCSEKESGIRKRTRQPYPTRTQSRLRMGAIKIANA